GFPGCQFLDLAARGLVVAMPRAFFPHIEDGAAALAGVLVGHFLQEFVAGAQIRAVAIHAVVLEALGAVEDRGEQVLRLGAGLAGAARDFVDAIFSGARHQPIAPIRQVTPSAIMRSRVTFSTCRLAKASLTALRSSSVRVGSSWRQTSSASAAAFSRAESDFFGSTDAGSGVRAASSDSARTSGSL